MSGSSPRKIAKNLNDNGITTLNGCKWCDFNIRYILKNITYTGNMLMQKSFIDDPISKKRKQNIGELTQYFVENTHEPIIDKTIFDKVQSEFITRSKNRKSVFAQKLICGICGERYVRNTCGNPPYKLWVCKTKKNCGCSVCGGVSIREEKLKEVSAEILGLKEFDDTAFIEQIKSIIMEDKYVIRFEFYNGNVIMKKI